MLSCLATLVTLNRLRAGSCESDGTKEWRVSWCVSISDSREHTVDVAPVRVTLYSCQTCWNAG